MACLLEDEQFLSHLKKVYKELQQACAIVIPAVTALRPCINIDVYKSDCGII